MGEGCGWGNAKATAKALKKKRAAEAIALKRRAAWMSAKTRTVSKAFRKKRAAEAIVLKRHADWAGTKAELEQIERIHSSRDDDAI